MKSYQGWGSTIFKMAVHSITNLLMQNFQILSLGMD